MGEIERKSEPCDPTTHPLRAVLELSSSPEYLSLVRTNTRWFCERARLIDADASRVVLGIVEAVTNVIRHAYAGDPRGEIVIVWRCTTPSVEGETGELEIEVLDRAPFVAPEERRGRDLADVRPGGLGTHLMSCCMDQVEYTEREGGGTSLRLRKLPTDGASGADSPAESRGT